MARRPQSRRPHLRLAWLPLAYASVTPSHAQSGEAEFDEHMLTLRGIDPALAAYFRAAPRFTAGRHVVAVSVNGKAMGRASARFDERGALCVDPALLDVAAIEHGPMSDRAGDDARGAGCIALATLYPAATAELLPGKAAIALLVPTDALRAPRQDAAHYLHGGTAALMNYEISVLDSHWASRRSRYGSANTELGFNAGGWVVRSRQIATASDGRHRVDVLDTYAQRSFPGVRGMLQVGEINLLNPTLPGTQMTGVQLMSEQAMAARSDGATVEGVAQSQARIDVRQDGVLVYSTVVPAGPFRLTDVPRIDRHADLEVTVSGSGGESQRFTVAAAMAGSLAPSDGYAFAAGKVRNAGGIAAPWVISAGWTGPVRRHVTLSGGALAASNYHALGLGLGMRLASDSQLQFTVTGSTASRERVSGVQAQLTLSQRMDDRWSLGVSQTRQSRGHRDLLDTVRKATAALRRNRYRDQSSVSLSWAHPRLGSLSAGYSRTVLFDGRGTRRALASWGAGIGRASVSLSAEWNLGRRSRRAANSSLYLTLSVPLGENRRVGASVRQYAGETRYGANVSEQINPYVTYRAGMEYRTSDRRHSLTTAISLLPRYAQLDAGYARDPRSSHYSAGIRGGLVLHRGGVTASPYAVRDTFGLLSMGDASGIRISTPAGPVWTDARGYAVLPQLSPFGKSHIEVSTDSLPRNVDIHNGAAVVEAGRGAVTTLNFAVKKTRRVLLHAHTVDGRSLPVGAAVTDGQDDLVGLVQVDGEIFVPNALATPRLRVSAPGLARCTLDIPPGDGDDADAYYTSATAVCHAAMEGER